MDLSVIQGLLIEIRVLLGFDFWLEQKVHSVHNVETTAAGLFKPSFCMVAVICEGICALNDVRNHTIQFFIG